LDHGVERKTHKTHKKTDTNAETQNMRSKATRRNKKSSMRSVKIFTQKEHENLKYLEITVVKTARFF